MIETITDHKSLFIEAKRQGLNPISYSQISLFNKCQYAWQLKYIDKIKYFDQNINLIFGTAMHETIQDWLDVRYNKSAKEADLINLPNSLFNQLSFNFNESMKGNTAPFTNKQEMMEYYQDGVEILDFLKKNQNKYFPVKGYSLIGCEIALLKKTDINGKVAIYGFIDVGLKNETTGDIIIYDIKTSKAGWNEYKKKDFSAIQQLLIYKEYYSKQFNVPIDKIQIAFFIVKRKLHEKSIYPQKRIQVFVPASGKITMKKSSENVNAFIKTAFDSETGELKKQTYPLTTNPNNCTYCEYKKHKICPLYSNKKPNRK